MNLKRAYIYLLSFLCLSFFFSACYYLSYRHALNQFNKNAIERRNEFAALENNTVPTPNLLAQNEDSTSVDTIAPEIILPTTKYILEIYNLKTKKLEAHELNPPGYLVGLSREGVMDYLNNYMSDLTLSEYNKGLLSYELLRFSGQEVVLRKSYDEDTVPFRFYVVVKNGYVVVYNSDLKSVHTYTHIEAKNLPEEDRIELSQGIYINTEDELYSLLESYTS